MTKTKQIAYQPNLIMTFIFMGVIVVGLIVSLFMMGQRQELRKKATGVDQTARLILLPNSATGTPDIIPAGSAARITLSAADKTQPPVDGFQVIATITGTIPKNLTFVASPLPGLRLFKNVIDAAPKTGKQLTLVYVTQTPTLPYLLKNANLGSFNFTAPMSGSMTISFSGSGSLITKYQVSQNILQPRPPTTFTFATPTPTPTPTPRNVICPKVMCPDGGNQIRINGKCGCPPSGNPVE